MSDKPPRPRWKRYLRRFLIGFGVLVAIIGGVAAWALNRYVIDHVKIGDVAAYEATVKASTTTVPGVTTTTSPPAETAQVTSTSYSYNGTTITTKKVETGTGTAKVTYYVADVVVADATVLRSAFAENKFGQNIIADTSTIAKENDAIFAINGDYYGFRTSGIIIRNGVIFRDKPARQGLALAEGAGLKQAEANGWADVGEALGTADDHAGALAAYQRSLTAFAELEERFPGLRGADPALPGP